MEVKAELYNKDGKLIDQSSATIEYFDWGQGWRVLFDKQLTIRDGETLSIIYKKELG